MTPLGSCPPCLTQDPTPVSHSLPAAACSPEPLAERQRHKTAASRQRLCSCFSQQDGSQKVAAHSPRFPRRGGCHTAPSPRNAAAAGRQRQGAPPPPQGAATQEAAAGRQRLCSYFSWHGDDREVAACSPRWLQRGGCQKASAARSIALLARRRQEDAGAPPAPYSTATARMQRQRAFPSCSRRSSPAS